MTDERPLDPDPEWYESRWKELMEVLSVSDPEAVVDEVRGLQTRVDTLTTVREALTEAGVDDPEQAAQMIDNMADQLEELYAERERRAATDSSSANT